MKRVEKLIGVAPHNCHAPRALARKRGMMKPIAPRRVNKLATSFIQRSPETTMPWVALPLVHGCNPFRAGWNGSRGWRYRKQHSLPPSPFYFVEAELMFQP
jgi:hypothetical protein